MKRLIIAAVACVATLAHAEFYSGNELYTRITSSESWHRSFVNGYVSGIADAAHGVSYCPQPNVTLGQLVDLTKQLLERMPAQRHASADGFVVVAITTAFPCAKQQKKGGDV
jgi:hypothetical protein